MAIQTPPIKNAIAPPGPQKKGLMGEIPAIRKNGLINHYVDLWRTYGDIVKFETGPVKSYMVVGPEYVQHVMLRNRDNYPKGRSHDKLREALGYGLLTSENPLWRTQRKLMQPTYTPNGIRKFADVMVASAQQMLEEWKDIPEGETIVVNDEMMKVAMRVISQSMFGVDISKSFVDAGDALTYILEYVSETGNNPLYPPTYIPTAKNRKFNKALKTIDEFIYGIIDQRQGQEGGEDLLQMLMTAKDAETGEVMSRTQLRDEVLVTFFAGHETTASLMGWAFYLLSLHPDVEARFHSEIDAVLEGRSPTLDDIDLLPYTRMIIDETLRLYSPVGVTARDTVEDDVIDGYAIEKGSLMLIFPYGSHRHPDFWEHPMAFYPEHFTEEAKANRPRYAYYPFGAGPRTCIGSHFALMEAVLIMAEVGQRYRLNFVPQPQIDTKFIGVMRPTRDIKMTLEKR